MKSLEERHAQRQRHREEGPGPVVIEKDPEGSPKAEQEEEREPMRNKAPGSSYARPGEPTKVEGDDSIDSGFTFVAGGEQAAQVTRVAATATPAPAPAAPSTPSKKAAASIEAEGNGAGNAWKKP